MDRFMKDMESVMGNSAVNLQDDAENGSSSDIDFGKLRVPFYTDLDT